MKNRIDAWLVRNMLLVTVGLCMALIFSTGFAVVTYTKSQSSIKDIKTAAVLACESGKPSLTRLFIDLANDFQRKADNDLATLKLTKVNSPLYNRRVSALQNDQDLVTVLHDYLPIQCVKRVQAVHG